jgi:hypothetical protein
VVNDALASLDADFETLYTDFGRPSIPPERLIRPRWCGCRPSPKGINVPTFVVIKATEMEKDDTMKDTMIGVPIFDS